MARCKGRGCKHQASEHVAVGGYCLVCTEERIKGYETAWAVGYEAALRRFSWWKDGIQYAGSCGTTLEEALKEVAE